MKQYAAEDYDLMRQDVFRAASTRPGLCRNLWHK